MLVRVHALVSACVCLCVFVCARAPISVRVGVWVCGCLRAPIQGQELHCSTHSLRCKLIAIHIAVHTRTALPCFLSPFPQSALAKERKELKDQQQRTLLDAIPKDLSRPWEVCARGSCWVCMYPYMCVRARGNCWCAGVRVCARARYPASLLDPSYTDGRAPDRCVRARLAWLAG